MSTPVVAPCDEVATSGASSPNIPLPWASQLQLAGQWPLQVVVVVVPTKPSSSTQLATAKKAWVGALASICRPSPQELVTGPMAWSRVSCRRIFSSPGKQKLRLFCCQERSTRRWIIYHKQAGKETAMTEVVDGGNATWAGDFRPPRTTKKRIEVRRRGKKSDKRPLSQNKIKHHMAQEW